MLVCYLFPQEYQPWWLLLLLVLLDRRPLYVLKIKINNFVTVLTRYQCKVLAYFTTCNSYSGASNNSLVWVHDDLSNCTEV